MDWRRAFYDSDSHAESAAAVVSLIASCRLHSVDAQQYRQLCGRIGLKL